MLAHPAALHVPDARRAAAAGVASLVEKPPALSAPEAEPLLGLDPAPWMGFNRRFEPEMAAAGCASLARARHRAARARAVDPPVGLGRADGSESVLLDLGPHLVDLALWLTGRETGACPRRARDPTEARFELDLGDDVRAGIAVSHGQAGASASSSVDGAACRRRRSSAAASRAALAARLRAGPEAARRLARGTAAGRRRGGAWRTADPRLASCRRRRRGDERARRGRRREERRLDLRCDVGRGAMLALIGLDAIPAALLAELEPEGLLPRLAELRQRAVAVSLSTSARVVPGGRVPDPLERRAALRARGLLPLHVGRGRAAGALRRGVPAPGSALGARLRAGGRVLVVDPYEAPPAAAVDGLVVSGWQFANRVVLRPVVGAAARAGDVGAPARPCAARRRSSASRTSAGYDGSPRRCARPARAAASSLAALPEIRPDVLVVGLPAVHLAGTSSGIRRRS